MLSWCLLGRSPASIAFIYVYMDVYVFYLSDHNGGGFVWSHIERMQLRRSIQHSCQTAWGRMREDSRYVRYVPYVYLIMPCQLFGGKLLIDLVSSFFPLHPRPGPTHIILRTVQYIPTLPARPVYILVLHRARSMAYVLRNCPSQCVGRRTRMEHTHT